MAQHCAIKLSAELSTRRWKTPGRQQGIGLNKILGTIHIYPTLAEANKQAAGAWRRAHISPLLLRLLKRFHTWRRG